MVLSSDLMNCLFNILVGGFRLFCIDYIDIMVFLDFSLSSFHLIGVKHQDQGTFFVALIITEHVHQFISGPFNIHLGQFLKIFPGKNNIVSVYQKIFFLRLLFLIPSGLFRSFLDCKVLFLVIPWSLYRAVSTDKNLLQFLLGQADLFKTGSRCRLDLHFRLLFLPKSCIDMGILLHLIPGHIKAGSVGTKNRSCRIFQISFRIISRRFYDLLTVVTRFIAFQYKGQMPPSSGIGCDFSLIVPHLRHRSGSRKKSICSLNIRSGKSSAHPLDIGHSPANRILRHLQGIFINRLQKDTFCLSQSLAHRPVGGLAEISPFRMFQVGPSGDQSDLHVCNFRPRKDTQVMFLLQMGKDQSLPVSVQNILAAVCGKNQSCPSL